MGVPHVLATELVVHVDRKVVSMITKQEAIDVIGRLTTQNKDFDATQDQWTPFDVEVLEKALAKIKAAVESERQNARCRVESR